MPKLVWRVQLIAEMELGMVTETGVARFKRDREVGSAGLGLGLTFDEAKQLIAALHAQMVQALVAIVSQWRR